MAEAMVTGRMSAAKKQAGNRVLRSLGLNASQAINQLYDFLIEEQALPFAVSANRPLDADRIREARSFVVSIPRRNRFSEMTDEQIKQSRLAHLGVVAEEER